MRLECSRSQSHCIKSTYGRAPFFLTAARRRDTMSNMSTLIEMVADEVALHYVSPSWVAKHYGVTRLRVYRAIAAKRLVAVRVGGGSLVLDKRTLPESFPR